MTPWAGETDQSVQRPKGAAWLRVIGRLVWIASVILGLLGPMFMLRLFGLKHASQALVRMACRSSLRALGLSMSVEGVPMVGAGAVVSNHSSWLDIFVLNAVHRIYFVAKAEVANWPLIGLIARSVGTVFIRRRITDAPEQKAVFLNRIGQGDRLLFFPEGTSTDGQQVLPFKSSLFAAFFDEDLRDKMMVQPVSVRYQAPVGQVPWFYAWWGDMEFAEHFLMILAPKVTGSVHLIFHEPLFVAEYPTRKDLARAAEIAVRSGVEQIG